MRSATDIVRSLSVLAVLCIGSTASADSSTTHGFDVYITFGGGSPLHEVFNQTVPGPTDFFREVNPERGNVKITLDATSSGFEWRAQNVMTMAQAGGWFSANYWSTAVASTTDIVTVIGDDSDSVHRVQYHFDLDGKLNYGWIRHGGALDLLDSKSVAQLTLRQNGDINVIARQELVNNSFADTRNETKAEFKMIDQSHTVAFPITPGQPTEINFSLAAATEATLINVDGGEFSGGLSSEFGSTARLVGVSLLDINGNVVPGASLHSSSGLNYPTLVPEPALATFLFLLLPLTRRPRRR